MRRSRTTAMGIALVAFLATWLGGLPASPANAAAGCRWEGRGFVADRWLGGTGGWSDSTKWSLGTAPGTTGVAAHSYACIPSGAVVIDSSSPRIDLDLLELGLGSRLTLRPGTSLFLWGDQNAVRSITKRGSFLEVDGATLGGTGRLHVIGTIDVHASTSGSPAVLTSDAGTAGTSGPGGILEIGDEGTLDVRGRSDVRLAARYIVDVHGKARLRGHAGLVADHGTTFLLQQHYYGKGVGRLVIRNDRGFAEGAKVAGALLATFVNRGRIAKRDSKGTSRIEARYLDSGAVSVRSGRIRLPHRTFVVAQVAGTPITGGCGPLVPCTDPNEQQATMRLPVSDTDGPGNLTLAELTNVDVKGAVGHPMQVHASDLDATVADPAVILLRYDVKLFQDAGRSTDPATMSVAHADGGNQPYTDIPGCDGTAIPLGAFACLDRAASRSDAGTVTLVIRTIDTSRWIIP